MSETTLNVGVSNSPATNTGEDSRLTSPKRSAKKDQKKIADWIQTQFIDIKMARSFIERQWYLNLCFYYGKQNVVFRQLPNFVMGTTGSLYVPPAPYWRSRPVINRIRPAIRHELAKLTAQKPSAYVVPASSDDRDMFAAQAGDQIWDSLYRSKKLKSIFRRWAWWTLICGSSFLKCAWDPDAVDEDANFQGDICFTPETPFHIFAPDFRQEDLEQQPFLIHAQVKSDEWVKMNYPNIKYSANADKENEILDQSWLNLVGAQNMRGQKGVIALEAWVKPGAHSMFPQGAMFTVVGDTIVQGQEGWPYEHNKFPFAKWDHIPTGKFYNDSSIVDLIPLQREYNRTRGQIIEAKNRMAKPNLVAEKGSIDPSKITTEPGQVIEYEPGYQAPQPLPMVNLPAYVLQELDRTLLDINDVSGQHEVSKGQTPPGVSAATAINYLQEQDDSMMAHTYQSMEEGIEKIAQLSLSYVHQFWEVPRVIKMVGTDGSFDAQTFKGADLADYTDIRIESGSSLPTSKAAKQAFIMDLMKMGFIDPNTGLEVMEMGGIAKIYENVQIDVRQAQRENLKLAQVTAELMQQFEMTQQMGQMGQMQPPQMPGQMPGQMGGGDQNPLAALLGGMGQSSPQMPGQNPMEQNPVQPPQQPMQTGIVPVNTWDNHAIHVATHNKFRKQQSYDDLAPEAQQAFESHVQQHLMALQMTMTPPGNEPPVGNGPPEATKNSGAADTQNAETMFGGMQQSNGGDQSGAASGG